MENSQEVLEVTNELASLECENSTFTNLIEYGANHDPQLFQTPLPPYPSVLVSTPPTMSVVFRQFEDQEVDSTPQAQIQLGINMSHPNQAEARFQNVFYDHPNIHMPANQGMGSFNQNLSTHYQSLPILNIVGNTNGGLSTIGNPQAASRVSSQNMSYRPPNYLVRPTQDMRRLNQGLPSHMYQRIFSQNTAQYEVGESSMANQQRQAPLPLYLHYKPVQYITTNLQYQNPFTQNSRGNPMAWQSNAQNNNIPQMPSSQLWPQQLVSPRLGQDIITPLGSHYTNPMISQGSSRLFSSLPYSVESLRNISSRPSPLNPKQPSTSYRGKFKKHHDDPQAYSHRMHDEHHKNNDYLVRPPTAPALSTLLPQLITIGDVPNNSPEQFKENQKTSVREPSGYISLRDIGQFQGSNSPTSSPTSGPNILITLPPPQFTRQKIGDNNFGEIGSYHQLGLGDLFLSPNNSKGKLPMFPPVSISPRHVHNMLKAEPNKADHEATPSSRVLENSVCNPSYERSTLPIDPYLRSYAIDAFTEESMYEHANKRRRTNDGASGLKDNDKKK